MLQARSPVFEAMFSGAFVEADENVVITDMEPEPFKDLLGYMYTDETILTGDNVLPLLYAAEKYILENLANKCRKFLEHEICVDNVCSILTHSLIQQDEKLVNTSLDLIAPNAKTVVKTEAFYTMSHDALLKVVSCDQLAHGVEAELFEACIEWGKRKVPDPDDTTDDEIRDILGTECLHKIRFPYIPYKDFARKFGHTTVLTDREKSLIYPLLATQEESYSKALSGLGFDVASRMIRARRYEFDFNSIHKLIISDGSSEEFTFSVNKPVQLMGFSVHVGKNGSEHDVKITIQNTKKEEDSCNKTEQKIANVAKNAPVPVYVRKTPIAVNTEYRVRVDVKGTENIAYSYRPKPCLSVDDLTFSTKFIENPYVVNAKFRTGCVAEFLIQRLPSP